MGAKINSDLQAFRGSQGMGFPWPNADSARTAASTSAAIILAFSAPPAVGIPRLQGHARYDPDI
jgi:hypothetical protein